MMGGYIEDKWVYGFDTKLILLDFLISKIQLLFFKIKKVLIRIDLTIGITLMFLFILLITC